MARSSDNAVHPTVLNMSEYHKPDSNYLQDLKDIANKLRIHSVKATSASNSGSVLCIILAVIYKLAGMFNGTELPAEHAVATS